MLQVNNGLLEQTFNVFTLDLTAIILRLNVNVIEYNLR